MLRFLRRAARRGGPQISILIPAYAAESFIDRTLLFARGQTFPACRIVVSVDAADDRTGEIALRHSEDDPRVSVFVQTERQGWARNVNFLLEKVDTPFFCLYMHDDIILPQYVELLLQALAERPDAASAHCDMGHFGGRDTVSVSLDYEGSAARRLLSFFLEPERGSPLRSMIRTDRASRLRLPENTASGLWANEPFLMRLLAAGPAVAVRRTLYLRWDQRQGGLTDGWRGLSPAETFAGHRANTAAAIEILDGAVETEAERQALRAALYMSMFARFRSAERSAGRQLFAGPRDLHPAFADLRPEISAASFGERLAQLARRKWRDMQADERNRLPA